MLKSRALIKENSACAAIAQANLYNSDLPAQSKFILLTKLYDVTLVLIEYLYIMAKHTKSIKTHLKRNIEKQIQYGKKIPVTIYVLPHM